MQRWGVFRGEGEPHDGVKSLPAAPPWRVFGNPQKTRGSTYRASPEEVELVNAALYLRRPLLIAGKPGVGKSSLAYAVARELRLEPVLRWNITTRSTLTEALYTYDAIGRLQDANLLRLQLDAPKEPPDIGRYLRLGPLGTAMQRKADEPPRVLLVDEIDKSDIDLPNDLLHIFEDAEFEIPELTRIAKQSRTVQVLTADDQLTQVIAGKVRCETFPLVIFTSNGEREFPPAFLRRCLRITVQPPDRDKLIEIVAAHFATDPHQPAGQSLLAAVAPLVDEFLSRRNKADLSTDQLLNAVYLVTQNVEPMSRPALIEAVLRALNS
jgi:MoxR-like ATPase